MTLPAINIRDYSYVLPEERIAMFPLPQRDQSKLLVYQHGQIEHIKFNQLSDLLPDNSILFFNNTKVIPARFLFEKETGASIEVFLIHPDPADKAMATALADTRRSTWKCTIGNLKKWNEGLILRKVLGGITLTATLINRQASLVEFSWTPENTPFAEIVQAAGVMPLPPYIKRVAIPSDRDRYQTVYSDIPGAVAAPTAGLHFTEETINGLKSKKIPMDFLSLHVGAGTFLPVKVEKAIDHPMHAEQIIINRNNLENLLLPGKKVIAIGTTSLRTLESLYWHGVQLLEDPASPFFIDSFAPYLRSGSSPSRQDALSAVLESMSRRGIEEWVGHTSIFVLPGYTFRVCDGLVTNFHQPGSTLLLLIAAFVGSDWQRIYNEALSHDYRFLSYGDSSLLLR